jgi:uncharacterized protein (TIGR03067 family)
MKVLLTLALALFVTGGEKDTDTDKSDLDRLQGTWTMVSMETEGHEVGPENIADKSAVYKGNRLTLLAGDEVRRRGIVTLNPERTPKAINTWDQDGPFADHTVPGIYEIEGDTLKVCFAQPGEERPKKFTSKEGTGFIYCVYKRKKP